MDACERAWERWEDEEFDKVSFEVGFYEGSITARRITILQLIVVPFFVGGIGAALMNWWFF